MERTSSMVFSPLKLNYNHTKDFYLINLSKCALKSYPGRDILSKGITGWPCAFVDAAYYER